MSDPTRPEPLPYYTYPGQPMHFPPRRPTSVSVIGWIAAILGALGAAGGACFVFLQPVLATFQANNPYYSAMNSQPWLRTYNLVVQIIGILAAIVLLWAGYESLALKPRARKVMIGMMAYYMLIGAFNTAISYLLVIPAMMRTMPKAPANNPAMQIQAAVSGIAPIAGLAINFVLCGLIIYFYTRPHVKAAFGGPVPLPPPLPR